VIEEELAPPPLAVCLSAPVPPPALWKRQGPLGERELLRLPGPMLG